MTREAGPQNVFMDRFDLEPKVQRVWDVPHATWFTLMGVGGGVFVLSRLLGVTAELGTVLGVPLADVVSFVAIAVGGLILIADLGQPLRFWRAFRNVRTSWISWGAISDGIFLLCGGLLVLPDLELAGARPFASLPWDAEASTGAGRALELVGGAAAIVVMFYAGAVLAKPRAIPYWHSAAIPAQFMLSAASLSMATIMVLAVVNGAEVTSAELAWFLVFQLATLGLIAVHLGTGRDRPGKRDSIERLLRGRHRVAFVGGVVVLGTVVPALAAVAGIAAEGGRDAIAVLVFAIGVPAAFGLRLLTLRVGIFPPVRGIPGLAATAAAASV